MKIILILLLSLNLATFALGQKDTNILVLNFPQDKIIPLHGKVLHEISVRRNQQRTFAQLIEQVKDSALYYGGNCFLITDYDTSAPVIDLFTMRLRDYLQGRIYQIDALEKQHLQALVIEKARVRDSLKVNYTSKDVELVLGMSVGSFDMPNNNGYIRENAEGNDKFYGSFSLAMNRVWKHPKNRNANFRLGLGVARTYIDLYPNITLQEANIANIDTVNISFIDIREYQLLFPVGFSYTFPNILKKGNGLKIVIGVENRFQIGQRTLSSLLMTSTNNVYQDENLERLTNQYFSDFINPYTLIANIGFGFTNHEGVGGGLRYSRFLIHPFLNEQQLNEQFMINFYVDIQLFNFRKKKKM